MELEPNLPFVGQPALYHPAAGDPVYSGGGKPLAAIVCHVWAPQCVNLAVFDRSGMPQSKTSVPFVAEGDLKPSGSYAVPTVEVIPGVLLTADEPQPAAAVAAGDASGPAARVRSEQIDSMMEAVVVSTHRFPGTTSTVAIAALPDGFVLGIGHSACVSPAMFNAEVGVDMATADALKKAREKAWELEGYLLRNRLARAGQPPA